MWAKLDGEIIDIAAHGIPLTEDCQPDGKFFNRYGRVNIPVVWEKHPRMIFFLVIKVLLLI
ncbi:hypothetical protein IKE_06014 [Bacillus cereus VD196]|uniref:Uncharacterized protein n=1 Tax=Bacillus cereus VD196 TaxID=1053243 RepID=A0A9W5PY71_BACCE|nr:hypothetical protein [Bacillus cereus]EOO60127.1 hypothetical protein IKE_06014 [Bacillus cereus VD196]